MFKQRSASFQFLLLVGLTVAMLLAACGTQPAQPAPKSAAVVEKPAIDAVALTKEATWDAYQKVLCEVQSSLFPVEPATALGMIKDKAADYLIIDVRSAADYAAKHIKGAVNLNIVQFAENIDKMPTDKTLILYCYTGQSSALAMVPLKAYGYKAIFIKGGFGAIESAGFQMDTVAVPFKPVTSPTTSDPKRAAALTGIKANLIAISKQHATKTLVIGDGDVKELVDGSPTKYAFVDLRPKEDYEKSHIRGAISAPLADLKERIPSLPKDRRLVLCCKTGQLASMATAPLTAEGFKIISLCAGFTAAETAKFPMEKN